MNRLTPDPAWIAAVDELLTTTVAAPHARQGAAPEPAAARPRRIPALVTTGVTALVLIVVTALLLQGRIEPSDLAGDRLSPPSSISVDGRSQPYAGRIPWTDPASSSRSSREITIQADGDRIEGPTRVCGLPAERVQVRETARSITIAVFGYASPPSGFCGTPGSPPQPLTVRLRQPVGDRLLLDHATGQQIPLTVTAWPALPGATATIRGTAPTTSRMIAGVGTTGGPSTAELHRLRALAQRTGRLADLPDPRRGYQVRLAAAVDGVRAAFGSAAHEYGGYGSDGLFLVLNRAPTAEELQLLRLLPMEVRLSWGPRLTVQERDRQQHAAIDAAFASDVFDADGNTDSETDTQSVSYWPDRDHPLTASRIAARMVAAITRISGAAPTFDIEVTDRSRTAAGQAALHATGRATSDDGVRLLVGSRPTETGIGVAVDGGAGLGVNQDRCVLLGDAVVIAPPGSSISADGRTIDAAGIGTFPVHVRSTSGSGGADAPTGGAFVDAATAATYLPDGSSLCGATRFLLIQ